MSADSIIPESPRNGHPSILDSINAEDSRDFWAWPFGVPKEKVEVEGHKRTWRMPAMFEKKGRIENRIELIGREKALKRH